MRENTENRGSAILAISLVFVVPGVLGYWMNGINGLFIGLFAGPFGFFFNLWQMLLN